MHRSEAQVGMQCFVCTVEDVSKQQNGYKNNVVTQYNGTPLCAIHAKDVAEKLHNGFIVNPIAEVNKAA
jgi:hypothetical protein